MLCYRRFVLPLMLLSAVTVLGCEVFNRDDDDDDRDRRRVETSVSGIPRDAQMVEEARGEISFQFKEDGVAYLYDTERNSVIFQQNVRRDQRLTVDPRNDRATLDGRPVWERNLDDHRHRLYFVPRRSR